MADLLAVLSAPENNNQISLITLKSLLEKESKSENLMETIRKRMVSDNRLSLERIFNKFDINDSSKLDLNEFKTLMKEFGVVLDDEAIEYTFQKFDSNKDGNISIGEFKTHLLSDTFETDVYLTQPFFEEISL